MLNKRQEQILKVSRDILDIFAWYDLSNISRTDKDEINNLLWYDNAEQDIWCLVDDINIEFNL